MTEVRVFLGEKLKEYKENNRSEEYRHVDVITGRGLHSKDNIPKIKPAVEEYLDKHKYQYTWKAKGGRVGIDLASYVTTQEENYDYDD
ncbi:uncharacterized protein LOC131940955 [Physella acuta]|uniref:uncharacterized protein LOC131940955 n=1 Tax=Physella acuta TaxID=109671 RepID=UPI0027DCBAAF|nr:uncharacterized protein LOC131940955 [Physella acuta]